MKATTWNDEKVDQIVGGLLQLGVFLAAFVVFVGGLLYLFRFAHALVNYRSFHGEPAELRSFLPILRVPYIWRVAL